MPGTLTHSPADVIRQLLEDLGETTAPGSDLDWESFTSLEPDKPDKSVTVFDTEGVQNGRENIEGTRQEHHGIQVRVRSPGYGDGYTKARSIAVVLDESIDKNVVTISSTSYTVWAVTRTSDVIPLGKAPESKRSLFTINAIVALIQN